MWNCCVDISLPVIPMWMQWELYFRALVTLEAHGTRQVMGVLNTLLGLGLNGVSSAGPVKQRCSTRPMANMARIHTVSASMSGGGYGGLQMPFIKETWFIWMALKYSQQKMFPMLTWLCRNSLEQWETAVRNTCQMAPFGSDPRPILYTRDQGECLSMLPEHLAKYSYSLSP